MLMATTRTVLLVGETIRGNLSPGSLELLGGGREIADALGATLALALLGHDTDGAAVEAIARGADDVHVADDPSLMEYQPDTHLQVLDGLVADLQPGILLLCQSSMGRDLAPRLAYRLGTGLCMDCVQLDIDTETGLLRMTRPVYGSKALAAMVCRRR
jgi:electron transfer flavoprotein alpha subunit